MDFASRALAGIIRLLLLTFFYSSAGCATIIFLSWRPDALAVAVDGLKGYSISDRREIACKVVHRDDCIVTFSGAVERADRRFSAMLYAEKACATTGDIFAKAATFERLVRNDLQQFWRDHRQPLRRILSADKAFLNVVFGGHVEGAVGLVLLRFGERADGTAGIIERHAVPDGGNQSFVYMIGESPAVDAYLAEHEEAADLEPVAFVELMMRKALAAAKSDSRPHIGPPASVYIVTRRTIRWIKAGHCQGL